jgi:hypothetical protein
MTGWNLPPGVNVNDLPGNGPQDQAWEDLYKIIADYANRFGLEFVDSVVDAVGDSLPEDDTPPMTQFPHDDDDVPLEGYEPGTGPFNAKPR